MPRTKPPDRGWMPLSVSTRFTEAEAMALSDLARILAGGSVRQPLITALNKVRGDLAHARLAYAASPTGRTIPGLSQRDATSTEEAPRRRGRPPGTAKTRRTETESP